MAGGRMEDGSCRNFHRVGVVRPGTEGSAEDTAQGERQGEPQVERREGAVQKEPLEEVRVGGRRLREEHVLGG